MPSRFVDKVLVEVRDATNGCFANAIATVASAISLSQDIVRTCNRYKHDLDIARTGITLDGRKELDVDIPRVAELVDQEYLSNVIKLPTKILENILIAHDGGFFLRTTRTLEAIKDEIARRSLMNDTSETITSHENKKGKPKRKRKIKQKR